MAEEELLKEALTREQRAQIVETFIRHAFSKVSVSNRPPPTLQTNVSAEVKWALSSIQSSQSLVSAGELVCGGRSLTCGDVCVTDDTTMA